MFLDRDMFCTLVRTHIDITHHLLAWGKMALSRAQNISMPANKLYRYIAVYKSQREWHPLVLNN